MTTARRSEGPRAPLFYYGVLTLLFIRTALAQDIDADAMAACASIEDAAEKLACFEALVPEQRAPAVEPAPAAAAVEAATAATAAPVAGGDSAADATVSASANDGAEAFGQEHLDRGEEEPPALTARVVDVTRSWDDSLSFHLDNGQVWQQIEPRRFPYPRDGEFDVEITQGMMGDYRLRVEGEGRMVRIRRLK